MTIPVCPYCGNQSKLGDSKEVYIKSYGMIWICRPCEAWVGTHKNSERHAPLGRLANKELRHWKKKAHAAFDPIWKTKGSKGLKRAPAYSWLAKKLEIPYHCCHIGKFDVETCKKVVSICSQYKFTEE